MDSDMLQSIYAHASWANEKLFDTAAQIIARVWHATDDTIGRGSRSSA
jgi:hypothetical protein